MENNNRRSQQTVNHSHHINPLNKRREATDIWFVFLWGFVLTAWLVVVCYVLTNSTIDLDISVFRTHWQKASNFTDAQQMLIMPFVEKTANVANYLYNCPSLVMSAQLTLSLTVASGFLILGRYQPLYCCHTGVNTLVFLLLFTLFEIHEKLIMFLTKDRVQYERVDLYVPKMFTTVHTILALFCIGFGGIKHIPNVIRDTTRIYFRFPHLIFFVVIVYGVAAFIATLSVASMASLDYEGFLVYIILIGGLYLSFFLHYYGVAVVSKVAVSWNCTENKFKDQKALVSQCIGYVTRRQIGTIAFGATGIGPVISSIAALISPKRGCNTPKIFLDRVFDIILSIYLIFDITKYSLIVNSADGENFQQSTKEAFRLMKKNSSKSFSFISVLFGIIIGVLNIIIALFLITWIMWRKISIGYLTERDDINMDRIYRIYGSYNIICSILMLPLFLIVDSMAQTNYLCKLKEDEIEDDSDERMT